MCINKLQTNWKISYWDVNILPTNDFHWFALVRQYDNLCTIIKTHTGPVDLTDKGKLKIIKSAVIWPAYIGPYGTNDNHAEFSHVKNRTNTKYGLLHVTNGHVYINSNGKGSINMQHNNNTKHKF